MKEGFVAVEVVDVVGGAVFGEALVLRKDAEGIAFAVFAHALVERGEEEILQDGLIVGGAGFALGIEILEELGEIGGVEKLFRDEALFLEEPAEDEAREQADEAGGAAFLIIGFEVGGEFDLRERPEIPVGQLAVETLVEQVDIENLLPRGVQGVEIIDRQSLGMDEVRDGKGRENVEMAAMGSGERDVAN